jgi:cell division protein FtsW (lipid II flippase)
VTTKAVKIVMYFLYIYLFLLSLYSALIDLALYFDKIEKRFPVNSIIATLYIILTLFSTFLWVFNSKGNRVYIGLPVNFLPSFFLSLIYPIIMAFCFNVNEADSRVSSFGFFGIYFLCVLPIFVILLLKFLEVREETR